VGINFRSLISKVMPESVVSILATIVITGILVATSPAMASAQMEEDSAAVRAQIEAYRNTWNTHNAAALAGFFTAGADFVMGNLPAAHGRQAIQDWWQHYFAKQEPDRIITFTVNSVRFVEANVAIANIATATGSQDPQSGTLPIRKARGTWLLHRDGSEWLISAMRGFPTEKDSVELNSSLETSENVRPQIRALVRRLENAFDARDISAISVIFREDADILIRNAPLVHGRTAIIEGWRRYFANPRPYKVLLVIDDIRMIEPDVAVISVRGTGAPNESGGKMLPTRYTRATWVVVREAGEWKIEALWVLPSEEDQIIRRSSR